MNWSRFQNPLNEPSDFERIDEIANHKADESHDQSVDREVEKRDKMTKEQHNRFPKGRW